MNVLLLKGERVAHGYTQRTLAETLHIKFDTYRRKELGMCGFKLDEIVSIANLFELSPSKVNAIFLTEELTVGNKALTKMFVSINVYLLRYVNSIR